MAMTSTSALAFSKTRRNLSLAGMASLRGRGDLNKSVEVGARRRAGVALFGREILPRSRSDAGDPRQGSAGEGGRGGARAAREGGRRGERPARRELVG